MSPAPIANPMSVWPTWAGARTSGHQRARHVRRRGEASDGTTGVGVTTAGEPGCYIVEKHLSRFVEGEDPRNVERIYDCMWRSTINYGARASAAGDQRGRPRAVGPAGQAARRARLRAARRQDEGPAARLLHDGAAEIAQKPGFVGAKVPCPHGPPTATKASGRTSPTSRRSATRSAPTSRSRSTATWRSPCRTRSSSLRRWRPSASSGLKNSCRPTTTRATPRCERRSRAPACSRRPPSTSTRGMASAS